VAIPFVTLATATIARRRGKRDGDCGPSGEEDGNSKPAPQRIGGRHHQDKHQRVRIPCTRCGVSYLRTG
jgi:hypothetical protein